MEQNYFAIEFEAGKTQPSTVHYVSDAIEAHHTELSKLSPHAFEARLHELVEEQHIAREPKPTSPKEIRAWEEALAEKHKHVTYSLDSDNLHRGNGFGGAPGSYTPELQIFGRVEVPTGAEMWKIAPTESAFSSRV